jgi:hypothetical protein
MISTAKMRMSLVRLRLRMKNLLPTETRKRKMSCFNACTVDGSHRSNPQVSMEEVRRRRSLKLKAEGDLQKLLATEVVAKAGSLSLIPSSKINPQTGKIKTGRDISPDESYKPQ